MQYSFLDIETKWQAYWQENNTFIVGDDFSKPKYYVLDMFPYPSGLGLHVGHIEGYTATDIVARYKRMKGYNVLHPIGWDAFGLPAEQHAVKTGTHPSINTEKNINNFRSTLKKLGFSYDWHREINTTDPGYYKWTQWIFSRLYEKGLAYLAEVPVNWCEDIKAVLADEEVEEHLAKGYKVIQKPLKQWILKITAYAERLLQDLDLLEEWPESLKDMQRNWIGRSEGIELLFPIENSSQGIKIFTTRPDTLFGATYLTLAPEHPLVKEITTENYLADAEAYIKQTLLKSNLERTGLEKEKTGVFTGTYAINPLNHERIPIWISDFVLISYGTGAIMCVPGHDARDWEFAKKYNLPIWSSIKSDVNVQEQPFLSKESVCENSSSIELSLDGLTFEKAFNVVASWAEKKQIGRKVVNYKLRDWIFSRQRYWGEPIPIKHYEDESMSLETSLPLLLPNISSFQPTGTGESPLAHAENNWLFGKDSRGTFRRETNTMPQWAGSCWYYLRYISPDDPGKAVDNEKEKYWMNVDLYVGGAEHAVLHLLYARFWHKFLYDLGVVSTPEPFKKLVNQGIILGEDKKKMSKSIGNVVPADEVLKKYGADTIRLYEMFMGPIEQMKPWSMKSIEGLTRFLHKIWRLFFRNDQQLITLDPSARLSDKLHRLMHKTIKKVSEDIESMKFNTAISSLMIFVNALQKEQTSSKEALENLLLLVSPFSPHIAEELWQKTGHTESISHEKFPSFDEALTKDDTLTIAIQINGKLRGTFEAEKDTEKDTLINMGKKEVSIQKFLKGKHIVKEIVVPNKLINLVVKF